MNIAFIVDEFPSVSQTFVLNQITGLLARGHQVDIYAREVRAGEREVHRDVRRYGLLDRTHRLTCPANRWTRLVRGAELCARHIGANAGAVWGSLNCFRYGRSAASLTLLFETAPFFRRYDIVHCQFGHNGQLGAILKKLGLQKKLVVTFHGCDIRAGLASSGAVYRSLWSQADCLIAISKYNRDHLLRFGADPKKIADHPVGIDCRRFSPAKGVARRSDVRVLSVARLVDEKGLEFGIRALRDLRSLRPEVSWHYDILGEGPLRARLQQLIDDLELGSRVRLMGAKTQDDVAQALSESDVLLAPSVAEALPVSLMEALAAEVPVVATRVGSVDQIVEHAVSGYLVPPGDVAALCEGLAALIDAPERRVEMGRRGRRHVERYFDIERLNDRLVALYAGLLAGERSEIEHAGVVAAFNA